MRREERGKRRHDCRVIYFCFGFATVKYYLGLILVAAWFLARGSNLKIKVVAAGAPLGGGGGLRRKLRVLLAWRNIVLKAKSAWHHLSNKGMFESDY